jgi:hypothetical protein
MVRSIGMLLVVAAVAGGCSSGSSFTLNPLARKAEPHREELTQAEWRALRVENARRLRGEGIPAEQATTAAAVAGPRSAGQEFGQFLDFLEFTFWTFPKQAVMYYLGETPGKYARMMEDDQSADARRTGVLKLVTQYPFARRAPYAERYWQIAQGDPNPLARAAAVRALNRSRDARVTPVAIRQLDDVNPLIRLEAAKALANVPDEKAVAALVRHMGATIELRGDGGRPELQSENRDVRVACADALRNFPTKDVARALTEALREKEFEVSWQARKSLILMTGRDFRYDVAKWQEYLASAEKPFG